MNKKKVYIIHGRDGSPEHGRLYWLQEELHKHGVDARGLHMPHPELPTIDDRVQTLQNQIIPDGETYIVAHSVGVQTAMRRLEGLQDDQNIGGLISVAGWFNLENLSDEQMIIAKPWVESPIHTDKVRQRCSQVVALFSDDDPWVPVFDSEEFIQRLDAEVVIEHGKKHMYWLDPQKGYPLILDILLGMMKIDETNNLVAQTGVVESHDAAEEVTKIPKASSDEIVVRVLDRDGSDMGSFQASKHESLLETAEKHGIDIGYSCRSGACFSCACHVKQGMEYIDPGQFGYQLVDVDEGDTLTCIAGIMDGARDGEGKEIVIKRF